MNDLQCLEILAKAETRSRASVVQEICANLHVPCEVDRFDQMANIYLMGDGDLWLMAHHDVVNPLSDNANDNSASVVNAIRCKQQLPWLNVALTDGEEPCHFGKGSSRFAQIFKDTCPRVINLELTGIGGGACMAVDYWLSPLTAQIAGHVFNLKAPFSDAHVLRRNGIDAACVFTCTEYRGTHWDFSLDQLARTHTSEDSLDSISVDDMASFRERFIEIILSEFPARKGQVIMGCRS